MKVEPPGQSKADCSFMNSGSTICDKRLNMEGEENPTDLETKRMKHRTVTHSFGVQIFLTNSYSHQASRGCILNLLNKWWRSCGRVHMSSGEVRITIKVRKRVLDRQKVAVGPRISWWRNGEEWDGCEMHSHIKEINISRNYSQLPIWAKLTGLADFAEEFRF